MKWPAVITQPGDRNIPLARTLPLTVKANPAGSTETGVPPMIAEVRRSTADPGLGAHATCVARPARATINPTRGPFIATLLLRGPSPALRPDAGRTVLPGEGMVSRSRVTVDTIRSFP